MKLYLVERPNDFRTWSYPTFNIVYSELPPGIEENTLEIIEDETGEIFIEQYTHLVSMRIHHIRVSVAGQKSIHSDWIKRFSVVKMELSKDGN